MKAKLFIASAAIASMLLTACSSGSKFSAENFNVTPTPLNYAAGEVPATINILIPSRAVKKNAIVTFTPELRWGNESATSNSAIVQGEKVEANNQIISYKNGGHTSLRVIYPFVSGMESCDLYMTFDVQKGKKHKSLPAIKIGYGTQCTAALVSRTAGTISPAVAEDGFQRITNKRQDATIKFLVAQANLRDSELNSANMKDFIATLKNIKSDEESIVLRNIDVDAYASPEGGFDFNKKLAERRSKVSELYIENQLRKNSLSTDVDTKYTAEDWEGFQTLVSQSNLADKELILRVLSMYTDPEEREREIRNVASVYTELAEAVLPELRRARLTINYEVIGRSDAEILSTLKSSPSDLSIEEMLYAANILLEDDAEKMSLYNQITERFPEDYRAYNNIACLEMHHNDLDKAQYYLRRALALKADAAEPNANMAILAMQDGDISNAEVYTAKATGAKNNDQLISSIYITQGKFTQAAARMEKTPCNTALLAQILSQDYSAAQKTIADIKTPGATTNYLRAVLGARMGDTDEIVKGISACKAIDSNFAQRALRDIEFQNYRSLVESLF